VKLKWGAKGEGKPQMGGHAPPGIPLAPPLVLPEQQINIFIL